MEPAIEDPEKTRLRDEIAMARKAAETKRRTIIQQIRKIQPVAGKNLKDLEVPQSLYELAKNVVYDREPSVRFKKVNVYELLMADLDRRGRGPTVTPAEFASILDGWKVASISLFRYALNLILAPKRAEFKKMKLSTSFYVYNISRNLYQAEKVFHAMGYRSVDKTEKREGHDLVYEGDVNIVLLLETATDLLVMHEEVALIRSRMPHSLEQILARKSEYDEARFRSEQIMSQSAQAAPIQSDASDITFLHEGIHKQSNPNMMRGYANTTVGPGGPVPPVTSHPAAEYNHSAPTYGQVQGQAGALGYQEPAQYYQPPLSPSHQPPLNQPYITPQPSQQYFAPGVSQPSQQFAATSDPQQHYSNIEHLMQSDQPHHGTQGPPHLASYQQPDQTSGHEWVGERATIPTTFQNVKNDNYSGQTADYSGVSNQTPTDFSQPGHSHEVVLNPSSNPASPRKPTPAPRKTVLPQWQPQPTSTEHVEDTNILRMSMDAQQQRMQHRVSSSDSEMSLNMADTLPPPMTDFTSPPAATPCFESGIRSGLVSGITRGDSSISFDLLSDSGPQAMSSVESNKSTTSSKPQLGLHTDSDTSIDLYGSGPPQQWSSPPNVPTIPEEAGEAVAPPPSTAPTLVTQGSQDSAPHELPSDFLQKKPPTPKPRLLTKSKAQSVDEVEQGGQEKDQAKLRTSASGSNLVEMERRSRLGDKSHLTSSSTDQSPSDSPHSQRRTSRDRLTHEEWTPSALTPPSSPVLPPASPPQAKPRILPPKAQSVDVQRPGNREVTRFSSGSNLLAGKEGSKHLTFTTPSNQAHVEPDTPVVGIIPPQLMKMRNIRSDPIASNKSCDTDKMAPHSSAQDKSANAQLATNTQPSAQHQSSASSSDAVQSNEPSTQPAQTLPLAERSQDRRQDGSQTFLSKPPLLGHKTNAIISPTTAVAEHVTTSEPDQSCLDYGGDGAQALRRVAPRDRANAVIGRQKDKPSAQEKEKSLIEKPTEESAREYLELHNMDITSEIEEKFHVSLAETWVCSYCTQLNATSLSSCEVCYRPRESTV